MLIKQHDALEQTAQIQIKKYVNGKDATTQGAFPYGAQITFSVFVPRKLGATAVVLRLARDGGEDKDFPLLFCNSADGTDTYQISLLTTALCENEDGGLFYYEYLLLRGNETLFSSSVNNVDTKWGLCSQNRFRLLIYRADFNTPEWFHGGTMYHIFLDRFYCGEGKTVWRADAKRNPDWHGGIPQYPRVNGDPLANNVYFGGNLWGVAQKLDYLQSLGVTVLYLSPMFQSVTNHRYDTGDYEKVDEILGGEEAFDHLVKEAHRRNIRIVLDGVFNHTGDDSKYFNRKGRYNTIGAYQSVDSPYYPWYSFSEFPDRYECWWNIEIMPRLNHSCEACQNYFTGENGICARWLARGADGWRLDVADELPNEFLEELRQRAKTADGKQALIIGEVWENAADKIAYGKRRRYLFGKQLDSVMNYPFRNAVLAFLNDGNGEAFYDILTELYSSYPPTVLHALMNVLGTHDTERILTKLGDNGIGELLSNDELAHLRLDADARQIAIQKLKMASTLQFTVFGVPSVFYGDEAGLEGYHDPFCRLPFPWGEEDSNLVAHYSALGNLRRDYSCLRNGDFRFLEHSSSFIAYERVDQSSHLIVLANIGTPRAYSLHGNWKNALTNEPISRRITIPQNTCLVLAKNTV